MHHLLSSFLDWATLCWKFVSEPQNTDKLQIWGLNWNTLTEIHVDASSCQTLFGIEYPPPWLRTFSRTCQKYSVVFSPKLETQLDIKESNTDTSSLHQPLLIEGKLIYTVPRGLQVLATYFITVRQCPTVPHVITPKYVCPQWLRKSQQKKRNHRKVGLVPGSNIWKNIQASEAPCLRLPTGFMQKLGGRSRAEPPRAKQGFSHPLVA